MYIYICICVCMYIYIYICIYTYMCCKLAKTYNIWIYPSLSPNLEISSHNIEPTPLGRRQVFQWRVVARTPRHSVMQHSDLIIKQWGSLNVYMVIFINGGTSTPIAGRFIVENHSHIGGSCVFPGLNPSFSLILPMFHVFPLG